MVLCLLVATLSSYSQIPKQQSLKDFSTWSITPYGAITYENTDLEENDPFFKRVVFNRGLGLEVTKQLSHFTSVQFSGFNSRLKTSWMDYNFNTKFSQFDVRFRFNLTNGALFKKWQSTQIYAYAGYGVIWYDATRSDANTNVELLNVNDHTRVIPCGVGVKYRTGNRTSLSADLSYNQTNTDNLDAWSDAFTSKDGFTKITVGFTYNLGKKRILEWDYPWQYLVPDAVHDTTVVVQRFEYFVEPKKEEPPVIDTAVIYYLPDYYQIDAMYLNNLDMLFERAQANNYSIDIFAYCDSSGSTKGNAKLVAKRAQKVADYASKFVPSENITIHLHDASHALYVPEVRNRKVIVTIRK